MQPTTILSFSIFFVVALANSQESARSTVSCWGSEPCKTVSDQLPRYHETRGSRMYGGSSPFPSYNRQAELVIQLPKDFDPKKYKTKRHYLLDEKAFSSDRGSTFSIPRSSLMISGRGFGPGFFDAPSSYRLVKRGETTQARVGGHRAPTEAEFREYMIKLRDFWRTNAPSLERFIIPRGSLLISGRGFAPGFAEQSQAEMLVKRSGQPEEQYSSEEDYGEFRY
ncbi:unnamed protein product, partial [Mesorhabditis spiculigera]